MNQSHPNSLVVLFWLITRIVGWLLLGSFSCVVVALLIVIAHGQYNGLNTLQLLLNRSIYYVQQTASTNAINKAYQWLAILPNQCHLAHFSVPLLSQHTEKIILMKCWPYLQEILLGAKLLLIRLYCLSRWSALFLLIGLVGLMDGLTQRAIRRASAGRESALIYHQAKALVLFSLILGIFISLVRQSPPIIRGI